MSATAQAGACIWREAELMVHSIACEMVLQTGPLAGRYEKLTLHILCTNELLATVLYDMISTMKHLFKKHFKYGAYRVCLNNFESLNNYFT